MISFLRKVVTWVCILITAFTYTSKAVIVTCPKPEYGPDVDLVLLPHPHNCSQFFFCVHGYGVLFTCPNLFHFNPKLRVCDWPSYADCQVTPYPTTSVTEKIN